MNDLNAKQTGRRNALTLLGVGAVSAVAMPSKWSKPLVDAVILPAHAQTSAMCMTDATVGGPLLGNPSSAATCQAACEAEAASQNAQLCNVTETVDAMGATQCGCEIDLP